MTDSTKSARLAALARSIGRFRMLPGASKSFGLLVPIVQTRIEELFADIPYHVAEVLRPFLGMPPAVIAARILASACDAAIADMKETKACTKVGRDLYLEARYRTLEASEVMFWRKAKSLSLKESQEEKAKVRFDILRAMEQANLPPTSQMSEIGRIWIEFLTAWTGIVSFVPRYEGMNKRVLHLQLAPELMEHLDDIQAAVDEADNVSGPSTTAPDPWYLRSLPNCAKNGVPLVKRGGVLRGETKLLRKACDVLGRTGWRVNGAVLETAICFTGKDVQGLPLSPTEMLPRLSGATFHGKRRIEEYLALHRRRYVESRRLLRNAQDWLLEGTFFYQHNADQRGRVYPVASGLSPMSSDLGRALLGFSQPCVMRPDSQGFDAWLAYGMRLWGSDGSRERLVSLSKKNADLYLRTADDPQTDTTWTLAEEPWQFLAWCYEYAEFHRTGLVESRLPVSVDASAHGLQLYSLLMNDANLAVATGVIGGAEDCNSSDVYSLFASRLFQQAKTSSDPDLRAWVATNGPFADRLPRALAKQILLGAMYNQSRFGLRGSIADWLLEYKLRSGDDRLRGGVRRMSWAMRDAAVEALSTAPFDKMTECRAYLEAAGKLQAQQFSTLKWAAPGGLECEIPYRRHTGRTKIRLQTASAVVKYTEGRLVPDVAAMKRAAAPHYIQSIEAAILHDVVGWWDCAPITTRHDAFGTWPSHIDRLREALVARVRNMPWRTYLRTFHEGIVARCGAEPSVPLPMLGDDLFSGRSINPHMYR